MLSRTDMDDTTTTTAADPTHKRRRGDGGDGVPRVRTTLVAGNRRVLGYKDGVGRDARFTHNVGICFDKEGDLIIADRDRRHVRLMNPTTCEVRHVVPCPPDTPPRKVDTGCTSVAVDPSGCIRLAAPDTKSMYLLDPKTKTMEMSQLMCVPWDPHCDDTYKNPYTPTCIAVDATGTIFFTDRTLMTCLLRVDTADVELTPGVHMGTAHTTRMLGYDGTKQYPVREDEQLHEPEGVAVGVRGDVYVCDTGNHRVCRVDGVTSCVSSVAGTGMWGHQDGPADAATFNDPTRLVVDEEGTIIVVDTGNYAIRRIDGKTHMVTTMLDLLDFTEAEVTGIALHPDGEAFYMCTATEVYRVACDSLVGPPAVTPWPRSRRMVTVAR